MKKFLLATTAATFLTVPAMAADLPVKAPPRMVAAPVFTWTGFYIGANCGGAWGRTETSNTAPFGGFDDFVPYSYTNEPDGWTCGGQLGYNWQFNRVVFGIEGEAGWLDLEQRLDGLGPNVDDMVAVSYDWYATLTGRLGLAWNRALFYVKGGAAWARINNTATDLVSFPPPVIDATDFVTNTDTRTGYAVGGGIEFAFAPNWSVKAEYLFMDFGSYTSSLNLDGDTFEFRNEVHTAKVGINYRFGPVVGP
jgi:outer membrane immunogenic protein